MGKLIIIAEEGERKLLDKAREELGENVLPKLVEQGGDAELFVTGVGAINIIRSLQALPRDTELYNIGYAGSSNFDLGTWVEVTEVRLNHPNAMYEGEPEMKLLSSCPINRNEVKQAVCYTNTDFVLASDYKDCVFDMELAFVVALGFTRLHSLKYVSDNLCKETYLEQSNGIQ